MLTSVLITVLAASPLGMFVCHIAAYRLARAAGRRPTAHTSAISGIGGCAVAMLAFVVWLVWPAEGGRLLDVLCVCVYAIAVLTVMAILYLDVVNIAETSLHMHLLLEIAWGDRPSLRNLILRYSPERMVEERLERLVALGQVRVSGDRYVVADRSALRLASVIDAWRTVLGLPTSPDET